MKLIEELKVYKVINEQKIIAKFLEELNQYGQKTNNQYYYLD